MNRLQVSGLSKSYTVGRDRIMVLNRVSFDTSGQHVVAVTGPSGSGKSTLLNVIAGLDNCDAGIVCLNGVEIGKICSNQMDEFRNRTLGFVFQRFNLLPALTALENVELALLPFRLRRSVRRARAAQYLAAVGLGDRITHCPNQLSGGQQQRVAIARALVTEPSLVLADEPTGNLDTQNSFAIIELIKKLSSEKGTLFLLATHDLEIVRQADLVIGLKDGVVQ